MSTELTSSADTVLTSEGDGSGAIAAAPPTAASVGTGSARPAISLRWRAIRSTSWTTAGYFATQALRLGSSLILTRLFATEVMGLMMLVSVILQGLHMFSDIGIGPSIIQNKRGDKAEFLNTAWTIQVCRGCALWIFACLAAWPMAKFYEQPALLWLMPIVGFSAAIQGFTSTAMATLNRQLRLEKITILELGSYVLQVVLIVAWAVLVGPTVWALVVGTMASEVVRTVASHFMVPEHRDRFHWNSEDARSMIRFGRWIFISTALTFFAMQLDKLMFGKLAGPGVLAVYGIAFQFATIPPVLIKRIGAQVAFPALSEIARDRPEAFYRHLRTMRLVLAAFGLVVLAPLIIGGDLMIRLLYTSEWHEAGWMLQILAAGTVGGLLNSTYHNALLSLGRTFLTSFLLVTQLILLVSAALIGYHLRGTPGFIVGFAAVEWLNYPIIAIVMMRLKLWQPEVDGPVMAICGIVVAIALMLP